MKKRLIDDNRFVLLVSAGMFILYQRHKLDRCQQANKSAYDQGYLDATKRVVDNRLNS